MKTLKILLSFIIISVFAISCSKDDNTTSTPISLNYSNGNLSTGATSANGTAAPVGYTWSELQLQNEFTGQVAYGLWSIADDFIVPAGEKWTINKIIFYAYQTNYSGASSPINEVKYEIYSNNPSAAGTTKIFGDYAINKYVTAEDSKIYRIFRDTPDSNRKIYKITASATDLELNPGTYWIKWQTKSVNNSPHYHPYNTIVGSPGLATDNALYQDESGVWNIVYNGSNIKADFPFGLVGTKTKI